MGLRMKGPIHKRGMLLMAALLVACGGGGGGDGASCSPAPAITSTPPTSATVNQQYQYQVDFTLACLFFGCGFELLTAPPGAGIDNIRSAVFWTPDASQANRSVQFTIATFNDLCGHRATQSWLVLVSP